MASWVSSGFGPLDPANNYGTANLLDQIERTPDDAIRDRYEARLRRLARQKVDLERQRADDGAELQQAETSLNSFIKWKRDLGTLWQSLASDNPELRMRCAAHLRQFMERIEVFAVGHAAESETGDGEQFAKYIDAIFDEHDLPRPDSFDAFLQHITERRMSKEGRFYRIHYRTGATVDVVPRGSLATGWELVRDDRRKAGWRFVRPSIDRLWREYEAMHGQTKRQPGKAVSRGCTL